MAKNSAFSIQPLDLSDSDSFPETIHPTRVRNRERPAKYLRRRDRAREPAHFTDVLSYTEDTERRRHGGHGARRELRR